MEQEKFIEPESQEEKLQIKKAAGFGGESFYIFPENGMGVERVEEISELIKNKAEELHWVISFHKTGQGGGVDPQKPRWEIISQVSQKEAEDFLQRINENI